jgi:hypothetical protein
VRIITEGIVQLSSKVTLVKLVRLYALTMHQVDQTSKVARRQYFHFGSFQG